MAERRLSALGQCIDAAHRAYPRTGETALNDRYVYENTPRMELKLAKGGVRLAAYLNGVFR